MDPRSHPPIDAVKPRRPSRISEGLPFPLGATWTGRGVNFALFSGHATKAEVELGDNLQIVFVVVSADRDGGIDGHRTLRIELEDAVMKGLSGRSV